MCGPTGVGEATCAAAGEAQRQTTALKRTNEIKMAQAHEIAPLARLMPGIVAYLNAMRQAFLNAGHRLSG